MKRIAAIIVLCAPAVASAAPAIPEAIDVDRDTGPPGRPELGFDGGAPVGDYAFAVRAGYLNTPLTLSDGKTTTKPVEARETLSVGAAITVFDRIVVDAMLPMAHQTGARLQGFGDDGALTANVLGDLRFGVRFGAGHAVFLRGEATLPTGDEHEFAGSPGYTLSWSLIGRGVWGPLTVAATGGIRIRETETQLGDRLVGDEFTAGAGVVYALPAVDPLWCEQGMLKVSAEVVGAIGDRVNDMNGPSPFEARLGLVGLPYGGFQVGVRAGVGLNDEIGAPSFRAMVEIAWHAGSLERKKDTSAIRDEEDDDDDETTDTH